MAIIKQSETFLKNDQGPLDPPVAVKVNSMTNGGN